MAERVVQAPSLSPTATAVDRFVRPEQPDESPLAGLAEALRSVNPQVQQMLAVQGARNAKAEEAEGAQAEQQINPSISLRGNRDGWRQLISDVRKQQGDETANELLGSSPHFRRGLVKARANRIGLGLNDWLEQQWTDNVGGIRDVDDPESVQQWISEQAQSYAGRMGVDQIDPIIAQEAYIPRVAQAQEALFGSHMSYRSKQRVAAYGREFQAGIGMTLNGAGMGSSDLDTFLGKLGMSENSGRYSGVNSEGFGGKYQFGQGRLDDYNRATGSNATVADMSKNTPESRELQERVVRWHFKDIDEEIYEAGYLSRGYSLDGLRAVAHLGGKGGMHEFAQSGGLYDPADSNGTSLSDYYNKFGQSPAADLQAQLDTAITNGIDPSKANEALVDQVVAEARRQGDPALLSVLSEISTGSGKLGNIGWVKSAVVDAEQEIIDRQWTMEQRERQIAERERERNRQSLQIEGLNAILSDPEQDLSEMFTTFNDAGFPDLATDLYDTQQKMLNDEIDQQLDPMEQMRLSREIFRGDLGPSEVLDQINTAVSTGSITANTGMSLIDDLRTAQNSSDIIRDSGVQEAIDEASAIVRDRTELKDIMGNVQRSGREFAYRFEGELTDEIMVFLEDNPEASKHRVRKFAREQASKLLKEERYQTVDPLAAGSTTPTDRSEDSQVDQTGATPTTNEAEAGPSIDEQVEALMGDNPLESIEGLTRQQVIDAAVTRNLTEGTDMTPEEFVREWHRNEIIINQGQ